MTARDWLHPSPEMAAALALARRCTDRGGLGLADVAEWVMAAGSSLWYFQAAAWAEGPPPDLGQPEAAAFAGGCAVAVRIVDLGYDAAEGRWWPVRSLYPTEDTWAGATLALMDFGWLLGRVQAPPGVADDLELFLSIICGPRWQQRHAAMLRAQEQAGRLRLPRRRR